MQPPGEELREEERVRQEVTKRRRTQQERRDRRLTRTPRQALQTMNVIFAFLCSLLFPFLFTSVFGFCLVVLRFIPVQTTSAPRGHSSRNVPTLSLQGPPLHRGLLRPTDLTHVCFGLGDATGGTRP